MSQDKELEIQLQFLEEAQEYLDTIESALLGLAGNHIESQQMDSILRAAHSVKGGAGMMGYQTLSHLAHRLEDSFKVMKVQRNSLNVDAELEGLLLGAVDRLSSVLSLNRQGTDADPDWVSTQATPVFDQLHERLGDPVEEDANSMLGAEDGTNVAALLFETEVEGCLARLESVVEDPQAPCLEEEVSILAQELGGLGEMLQLEAFSSLCESVVQSLEAAPNQVREIAKAALQAWRRSQALVLVNQVGSLPTHIEVPGVVVTPTSTPTPATELVEEDWVAEFDSYTSDTEFVEEAQTAAEFDYTSDTEFVEAAGTAAEFDYTSDTEFVEAAGTAAEFDIHTPDTEFVEAAGTAAEFDIHTPDTEAAEPLVSDEGIFEPTATTSFSGSLSRTVDRDAGVERADEVRWQEVKASSNQAERATKDSPENTVRIPVRQLDRLNDLFGELTIERNGLSLHLARLRTLMEKLSRRVNHLEQSNVRLRTTYDTVATGVSSVPAGLKSLVNSRSAKPGGSWRPTQVQSLTGFPDENVSSGEPGDSLQDISSAFDALEMDHYSDLHLLSMEVMETIVQIQEVTSDIELSLEDTDGTVRELNQTAKQLQTNLTRVRMRPLSDLVGRFQRALRDLALQHGKEVELKVSGKGTLIDRSILEALSDPLMHLVRNAFDHGIEKPDIRQSQGKPAQGTIEIKAAHRGNQTIITISDDGNGINLDKIRARAEQMGLDAELLAAASEDELLSLIFEPGFSTAERVTDLSGRGVGMDVVRNNLKQIRGDIRVDTQPGQGTTFTLTVPFTLSVARVLLVESNHTMLAFPTDVIEEMLLLDEEQILRTPGSEVLKWEEEMIPLIRLGTWLRFNCSRKITTPEGVPSISEPTVLMISPGDQLIALQVDRCWGEQEVAIRQVEGPLSMPAGFASCTILGDGKVVPLVDAASLLRWMRSERTPDTDGSLVEQLPQLDAPSREQPLNVATPQPQRDTVLVVDDSINVRRFLALALEKAGYLVEQAKDGQDAVEKLLGGLQVQAVICDIEMPRLDGYGFLARIKSDPAFSDLPVSMLTSRTGEKHRQLAMTLGASGYFSKPYNERELLDTLEQLIRGKVPV
ncbi:response regulator receiver domain protein [Coleofasciculus chthonoplastes PCC 7420]|uniref:histidine kinase n=1 Tax=Coleofasciculus chthonoplastes PCC 7420 TaxID=118168 RepID=B4W4U3_9CYAN|nr:hybrid sensor histidine kinase/response regulator [Coleofasciculus chthonoplastes]EDX70812.1 response regulator receiver domain protein [Coleofasciculus chthonoplastes PCC 7420]